jgi:hypothetical protein
MRSMTNLLLLAILASVSPVAGGSEPDAPLAGRWKLAEQVYDSTRQQARDFGQHLRVEQSAPVLSFESRGVLPPVATVRFGDGSASHEWPAVVIADRPVEIELVDRAIDLRSGAAKAHYRIPPPGGRGWALEIVESYSIEDDGSLAGTMTVRMIRDGEDAGGYALRRRFERTR